MLKLIPKKRKKIFHQDLAPYSGKWVALRNRRVAYSAATLETLMKRVRKLRQTRQVSVMLVPREDEGPYVLWL